MIKLFAALAVFAFVIGLTWYFGSIPTLQQANEVTDALRPTAKPQVVDLDQDATAMPTPKLVALTRVAFAQGSYKRALEFSRTLCQRSPDELRHHILRGEVAFANGKMNESVGAFDEAIRLKPTIEPRLWQRGLALYYADRFAEGVQQFETHQTVNSQDVENAVWHLLCLAREKSLAEARKNLIRIERDSRIPMAQIFQMFAGKLHPKDVLKAANQLHGTTSGSSRHHLQLYYAHLYIGLYQELIGDKSASLESMKKAVEVNPLPAENFMGCVAPVHIRLRATDPKKIK